jgi:membrane-associated phospholipid phosphatase
LSLRRLILAAAVLLLLVAAFAASYRVEKQGSKTPDVFSQGDIVVSQEQSIGKLLVVDGKATVDGRVNHWLAVIGGDLFVKTSSELTGGIFVLNGQLTVEPGAKFSPAFQIILKPGSPRITLLVWTLAIGVLTALAGLVLITLGLIRWFNRVDGYRWLMRHIPVPFWRWPGLLALLGLAVSGFLLAVFVHLARETIFYHEADFLDHVIIWVARYYANPALDKIMVVITTIGSGYAYVIFAPIIMAALVWWRRWREGLSLMICLAGASVLNYLLKHLFERARPDAFKVISESGYSFPSGHAMVSLCFYGMIAYIWGRKMPTTARQMMLYGATAVMIMTVGFSRIYLGVHYPSDVLGGYLAGATWLVFCMALLWWWETKRSDR